MPMISSTGIHEVPRQNYLSNQELYQEGDIDEEPDENLVALQRGDTNN